jgi:phage shock protein A
MGILARFNDIIQSNVNALLDKMEDPSKMIDQYLRNLNEDLAQVKKETASVMAEEKRTKRLVEENQAEVKRYADLAKKALVAGNEEDAKVFIAKKQELESAGAGLQTAYASAAENASKMRQMHDKLVKDIESLKARREVVKSKVAVAKTQETLNKVGATQDKAAGAMGAFSRMEEKADRMLDEANAMAELNTEKIDDAKALEEKYSGAGDDAAVNEELEKLKSELGL